MPYSIRAKKRPGYQGFTRGGIFFSSEEPTILDTLSDAVKNEQMLIIEKIKKSAAKAENKEDQAADVDDSADTIQDAGKEDQAAEAE